MAEITYPLDLTGTASTNKIEKEPHTILTTSTNEEKFMVPKCGCFYGESLKVYKKETDTDGNTIYTELRRYYDYIPTAAYDELSSALQSSVFGAIEFLEPDITGTLYLDYQIVGGVFYLNTTTIFRAIAISLLKDRLADWSVLVNVPDKFPLEVHNHKTNELGGFDALATALIGRNEMLEALFKSYLEAMKNHYEDTELHNYTAEKLGLENLVGSTKATDIDVINGTNTTAVLFASNVPKLQAEIKSTITLPSLFDAGLVLKTTLTEADDGFAFMMGQKFNMELYPELATIFGTGVIPDCRDIENPWFNYIIKLG